MNHVDIAVCLVTVIVSCAAALVVLWRRSAAVDAVALVTFTGALAEKINTGEWKKTTVVIYDPKQMQAAPPPRPTLRLVKTMEGVQ